jgi:hypothetical protein
LETADLFQPLDRLERLDDWFVSVATLPGYAPARAMARAVFAEFVDPDGNFVEQFQTSGFDSRTWELFLFAYLVDTGFTIDRTHTSPDFMCEKNGGVVAVEAVTANPSGGVAAPTTLEGLKRLVQQPIDEVLRRIEHEQPIRLGSPLFSKLSRRYWELEHVGDVPLVFAIESFAAEDSLYLSDTGLGSYLYGLWAVPSRTVDGRELVVTHLPLGEHRDGDKVIPSGFFVQPDTEHVSAVLFGNTGTFAKFGRMAVQIGLGAEGVRMFRIGTYYDHDPNASEPLSFGYEVATRPTEWGFPETWGEGLSIFHNPNALHPINRSLFPNIAHHWLEDGQIVANIPPFHPFWSQTHNLQIRNEDGHS